MRRIAILTLAVGGAIVGPAGAHELERTRVTCDHQHGHGGKTYAPLIRRAWAERKWRERDPVSAGQAARIKHHRRCAHSPRTLDYMIRASRRQRDQFKDHRRRKLNDGGSWCSPDPIAAGSGCWEIPTSCVISESGGSWAAANPSGAVGPYQLLGHGAPFPVSSRDQALVHHRIAESLYRSSGLAPWVAPGC